MILPLPETNIKNFWDKLATVGPKYGNFPKSKSYLTVKKLSNDAKTMFTDTSITITTDGRKYLGAVVGSDTYQV